MNSPEYDDIVIGPALATAMAEAIEPYELGQQQRDAIKSRIMRRIQTPAAHGTSTIRFTEGTWFNVTPLIEKKILHFDESTRRETSFWKLQAGAVFPVHNHSGLEECTVLEGDVKFGDHLLRKGDFHMANTSVEHQIATSQLGALLLISASEEDAAAVNGENRY